MSLAEPVNRVLVVAGKDADFRKVLASIRALACSGVKVSLASNDHGFLPAWSRYCIQFIKIPDPAIDADITADALVKILERQAQDAVLPLCDYSTQVLVQHQKKLTKFSGLCVPGAEQLAQASDKAELLATANDLGIGVPQTILADSGAAVERASALFGFPCVLKLRRGSGGVGLSFPKSADELARAIGELGRNQDSVFDYAHPLIQEFIPGEIHDACVLFNHGEPRAVFTQRRITMHPPGGGVGVYNESTDEPDLRDQAITLMRALRWHGPAQIEFKRDSRSGQPVLMEVNPRFWGTVDLGIRAGVNFPLLTARIAAHGEVQPVWNYRTGVRMRWMFCYGSPAKPVTGFQFRALLDALPGNKRNCSDFWWSDPLPHVKAALQQLTRNRLS